MYEGKSGVYIIAEIGGNHEGDFHTAKKLLKQAAESVVDAVKFQIYSPDGLVNRHEDPDRAIHFSKFALKTEEFIELAQECTSYGVDFNASIWDFDQIEKFNDYLKFYKIGSGDLTAYPFLKKISETNKPIILSAGLATFQELKYTIEYLCKCNDIYNQKDMIAILQCTSMYPIPDLEANLNVISKTEKDVSI